MQSNYASSLFCFLLDRVVAAVDRRGRRQPEAQCVVASAQLLSQASLASVCSFVHHKLHALQRDVALLLAACTTANASIIQRVAATPLARGAVLRVASDLTGGLPLEQWKTRVTRFPNETAVSSLKASTAIKAV